MIIHNDLVNDIYCFPIFLVWLKRWWQEGYFIWEHIGDIFFELTQVWAYKCFVLDSLFQIVAWIFSRDTLKAGMISFSRQSMIDHLLTWSLCSLMRSEWWSGDVAELCNVNWQCHAAINLHRTWKILNCHVSVRCFKWKIRVLVMSSSGNNVAEWSVVIYNLLNPRVETFVFSSAHEIFLNKGVALFWWPKKVWNCQGHLPTFYTALPSV